MASNNKTAGGRDARFLEPSPYPADGGHFMGMAARACAAGWRVRIVRCPDGSDWNDLAHEVAA